MHIYAALQKLCILSYLFGLSRFAGNSRTGISAIFAGEVVDTSPPSPLLCRYFGDFCVKMTLFSNFSENRLVKGHDPLLTLREETATMLSKVGEFQVF